MIQTKTINTSVKTAINTKGKSIFLPAILMATSETDTNRKTHNAREDL